MKRNPKHSNLRYSDDFLKSLEKDKALKRDPIAFRKVLSNLDTLNDHGTNLEFHTRGSLENLHNGWWSLRIMSQNNYWRIIFRRAQDGYGLVIMFLKKDNKILKKHWDKAKKVAKEEGWV
ncbi:type II toxin-antitoxin system RelE/ParE family toxin [Bacillus sp. SCS-151]|uniref:type II toxin-antitoxin system RelE/ParE family toxin n=1 Tax=Nanhaiella sioensis TaxID=3115293 RepID=UPI00397B564D